MDTLVRFYRAIPDARHPAQADKSASGSLPTKAYRYCEPVRAASGFGWYLYPPHDLSFRWQGGTEIEWWFGTERIGILNGDLLDGAQYPDFAAEFDARAPADCVGFSPPFLGALQEPGLLQIWTGWLVQTAPDWSVLVRPLANRPKPVGFELYEGIVETDHWFGPLFTNLRLTRTNEVIHLKAHRPLLQLQLLPRLAYQAHVVETRLLDAGPHQEGMGWDDADWVRYHETVVKPNVEPARQRGAYAVKTRQRGCPILNHGGEHGATR